MSPNVMYSVSLESYNPYLHPQKVSKNPKFIAFIAACPKMQRAVLALLVF
jgi:hypothetical protein